MILSASSGERELHPEGMHPAVCIMMAGIGTQMTPFKNEDGTDKVQKKMILSFETEHGIVSKEYTMSLSDKANLRAHLESWRGKKFTQEELEGFDPEKLLGKTCTVQVMHNDKGTFANIQNVLPETKKFKATKPTILYDIENHTDEVFDRMPSWVQDKAKDSFEWKEIAKNAKPPLTTEFSDSDEPIDSGDIPF